MTAPAFTCRCIKQAEAIDSKPYFCSADGNHFDDFYRSWFIDNNTSRLRIWTFSHLHEHYEAHALGAPHSHIKFLKGNDVFRSGFSWEPVQCSCHHVEQNAEPGPDVMRRGPGLTNAKYIASAP